MRILPNIVADLGLTHRCSMRVCKYSFFFFPSQYNVMKSHNESFAMRFFRLFQLLKQIATIAALRCCDASKGTTLFIS